MILQADDITSWWYYSGR